MQASLFTLISRTRRGFLVKIVIFAVLCVAVDRAGGYLLHFLQTRAQTGYTAQNNYITDKMNEELLIWGSSRAVHHYVPQILKDSLHLSSFNCGKDGNGIIYEYGKLLTVFRRYYPRIIILELTAEFDQNAGEYNHKYIDGLKEYYDYEGIAAVLWDIDHTEKYKMYSRLYRHNSKIANYLMDNFSRRLISPDHGYIPLAGEMKYEPKHALRAGKNEPPAASVDSVKLRYFEKLIKMAAGNTFIIAAISPVYKARNSDEFKPLKEMCARYNIPLLDHYSDERFCLNKRYFKDSSHLNTVGAAAYTETIAAEIQSIIRKLSPSEHKLKSRDART